MYSVASENTCVFATLACTSTAVPQVENRNLWVKYLKAKAEYHALGDFYRGVMFNMFPFLFPFCIDCEWKCIS